MDTKIFVETLRKALGNHYKADKKLREAWLTEVNAGGLYHTGMYSLYLKTELEKSSRWDETRGVIHMLNQKAPDVSKLIWAVKIYHPSDRVYCSIYDICVLGETPVFQISNS